ncbi:MAG: guanine-specific ribonuclease N1 and T1 [Acidimicrobiia bacterium]|nr:guanine-specific ribonuclease N1 and T1 [Acidimicrobiia bacterium]
MSKQTRMVISAITILAAIVFGVIKLTATSSETTSSRSSSTSTTTSQSTTRSTAAAGDTRPDTPSTTRAAASTRASNLPTISVAKLPAQAIEVLGLIETEGPFPYRQDGGVFQNRERILPDREAGYYREYTVETPGSSDRGARRIIVGAGGERYYTADHYDSFREIVDS